MEYRAIYIVPQHECTYEYVSVARDYDNRRTMCSRVHSSIDGRGAAEAAAAAAATAAAAAAKPSVYVRGSEAQWSSATRTRVEKYLDYAYALTVCPQYYPLFNAHKSSPTSKTTPAFPKKATRSFCSTVQNTQTFCIIASKPAHK